VVKKANEDGEKIDKQCRKRICNKEKVKIQQACVTDRKELDESCPCSAIVGNLRVRRRGGQLVKKEEVKVINARLREINALSTLSRCLPAASVPSSDSTEPCLDCGDGCLSTPDLSDADATT